MGSDNVGRERFPSLDSAQMAKLPQRDVVGDQYYFQPSPSLLFKTDDLVGWT